MNKTELLEILDGYEILSVEFSGCVSINDGQIRQCGEIVDSNPTNETLNVLFDALCEQEGVMYLV